jgi:hypothetical protein
MHFTPLPARDTTALSAAQFERLARVFALAHAVGDALGSEATDPAHLILVDAADPASCAVFFPKEFSFEVLPATRSADFLKHSATLADLAAALPEPTWFAFRESSTSEWICILWETKAEFGANLLLRGRRVET